MQNVTSKFLPATLMDPTKSHELIEKLLDFNIPTSTAVQLFFDWLEELAVTATDDQIKALMILTGAVSRDELNVP